MVEYDVVHRPDVALTRGAITTDGGVRLTHCDTAVCARLAEHVREGASAKGLAFRDDGALTLHIEDVQLGNAAAILYDVPQIQYVFQTAPDERASVEVGTDVENVEARCRSRFYAFLDQTEEIRAVTQVRATLSRREETVWESRTVHGDEPLLTGRPRFIYRAGDNLSFFGVRRALTKARVHDAVCRDSRVEYPLLGSGNSGFGTPKRREVVVFARSVEFKTPDLDRHLRAAADELVASLTAPAASPRPPAEDSAPAETRPDASVPEPGTESPSPD